MVIHKFVCDVCSVVTKDITAKKPHRCPKCNDVMRWDLAGIGIPNGDYNHISESLAIHPDQTSEHRKKFPNINVLKDGRLHFTSTKQQEHYANRCGFDKKSQRIRKRGIRIA